MTENPSAAPSLPPILPAQTGAHAAEPGLGHRSAGPDDSGSHRPGGLDHAFTALRRLPARDTDRAVVGGVCATLADRLGVSPAAVRIAAVLAAVVFGVGVGLYLIAWTVMPDRTGRTHLEQGLRHGCARSLAVLALGAVAALGVAFGALSFVAAILPQVIGIALLAGLAYWLFTHLSDRSRATS